MVKLYDGGAYLVNGTEIIPESEGAKVEQLTGKNFTNRYQSQELYNALMIYYFLEKG